MIEEIWRVIDNFPMYEVSNTGRIRSHWMGYIHFLKLSLEGNYLRVCLYNKKHRLKRCVHLLVLETFLSHRPDGLVANHKDGNKLNNFKDNLEWVTKSKDLEHAYNTGLRSYPIHIGKANPNVKLKEGEVWLIKKLLWFRIHQETIAKMFKVSRTAITSINTGKNWSYIKFVSTNKDQILREEMYYEKF